VVGILLAVGVVLAFRFGLTFPWAATMNALGDADPMLLAGAGLVNIASLMGKGTVWHLLLRRLGASRHGTAQSATFVGAAVNAIAVSVSGEAARAQMVHDRDAVPYSVAAASLVATRVVEALGLLVFLAIALALVEPWHGARLMALGFGGTAAALVICLHLVPRARWHRLVSGLAPATGAGWAIPVTLAALTWLAQWLAYHWSIQAAHAAITPAASLAALVLANIAGILRLTPGNVGVMQGSILLGMHAFKVPAAAGLAGGLALQAVQVIPILVIAAGIVGTDGLRRFVKQRAGADS
jgi:uncharacterized membrane protein YbhN (UPF0104 family)